MTKETALWGTYGKGGAEHCAGLCPEHPLVWKLLTDCDTEHLQAILRTQAFIRYHPYDGFIRSILKERKVRPVKFSWEAAQKFNQKCLEGKRNYESA